MNMFLFTIYIYIYIEREKEKENEHIHALVSIHNALLILVHRQPITVVPIGNPSQK